MDMQFAYRRYIALTLFANDECGAHHQLVIPRRRIRLARKVPLRQQGQQNLRRGAHYAVRDAGSDVLTKSAALRMSSSSLGARGCIDGLA